jgi:hypothetical protein
MTLSGLMRIHHADGVIAGQQRGIAWMIAFFASERNVDPDRDWEWMPYPTTRGC